MRLLAARSRLAALGVRCILALLATATMHQQRASAQTAVDLHLVLAVDASGSVSMRRFELQKKGYVAAFRNPKVLRAIRTGEQQAIAVTMHQWTGPAMQVQVIPWMLVRDEATIGALADAIDRAPRQLFGGGTSISGAIDYSMELFPRSPFRASRRVIDVSGDGANNRGRPAALARDEAVAAGVTINGLPILEVEPGVDEFYKNNVIGGPNAFMIPANTFEEFADAILRKLVLEIAGDRRLPLRVRADLLER
jgi:hypothetical protein